jgi:hypothetical protein
MVNIAATGTAGVSKKPVPMTQAAGKTRGKNLAQVAYVLCTNGG